MSQSTTRQPSQSLVDPASDPHVNGEYLRKNPTWHVEYSPAKADTIMRLLVRNQIQPRLICEVGCGAGEVLRQLQQKLPADRRFWGYDIAPDAIRLAWARENDALRFLLADFVAIDTPRFDLLLVLEVIDHIEDYLGFLRRLKTRAEWKLFSFTLDLSAQSALRRGAIAAARRQFDHLHHFNKEIALATLRHAGYEVIDCCYGPNHAETRLAKLAKPLRMLTFALNQDLSVRLFGGHSLVVLAR